MKYFALLFVLVSSLASATTILVMGDSLTEGYHLAKEEAYPYLIEQELKKTNPDIKVINGGVSGSTSASADKRLDWYLKAKPEIMVLALGANDGLRGVKPEETEKNLDSTITKAKSKGIKVILAGMKMPPNFGKEFTEKFGKIFPTLAKKHHLIFIPFILEGVASDPKLNLPDGIHPNPEGHKIMAKTVLKYLRPEL
ncbi:MAG: arylesterase [Bacteriovoracaceae bacterium]